MIAKMTMESVVRPMKVKAVKARRKKTSEQ